MNPVYAALKANRRDFDKIYLNIAEKEGGESQNSNQSGNSRSDFDSFTPNPRVQKVKDLAKAQGVTCKYMHRAKLAKFCGGRHHQNVVMKCGKIGY